MEMKKPFFDHLIYFAYATTLFAFIVTWGCASTSEMHTQLHKEARAESTEMSILQEGIEAFSEGDYNRALDLFEALSRQTQNVVILRRTLYALACTRLAQAQDENDFNQALLAWNRWMKLKPKAIGFEDPLMISPFLEYIASTGILMQADDSLDNSETRTVETCKAALDRKKKEIQHIKSKFDSKQNELVLLRSRIEKLKEQINSLEQIHLEIQEKKKEVSSQ